MPEKSQHRLILLPFSFGIDPKTEYLRILSFLCGAYYSDGYKRLNALYRISTLFAYSASSSKLREHKKYVDDALHLFAQFRIASMGVCQAVGTAFEMIRDHRNLMESP